MSETQTAAVRATPPPAGPPPAASDPVRDLATKLGRTADAVELMARQGQADPNLATELRTLARVADDPALGTSAAFRHRVAYAVEDLERTQLGRIDMSTTVREQLMRLAAGAPGLANERVADMLAGTREMPDRTLVQDIRRMAAEIGKMRDQHGSDTVSRIEAMENRVRLAGVTLPETARQPEARAATAFLDAGSVNGSGPAASAGATGGRTATSPQAEAGTVRASSPDNGVRSPADPATEPGNKDGVARTAQARNGAENSQQPQPAPTGTLAQGNVLGTLLRGMRMGDPDQPRPMDPPETPLVGRIEKLEARIVEERDGKAIQGVEAAGRQARDAIHDFRATPAGAIVMARIEAAARTDPGGIEGVLAEMRAGGRHAELRTQFDQALVADRAAAAAHQRASSAVADYGRARDTADPAISRSKDPGLAGRIQELDADIGKLAARTPGREEGKTLMHELADFARRTIETAVEAVRNAFGGRPDATIRSAPSPSPGP